MERKERKRFKSLESMVLNVTFLYLLLSYFLYRFLVIISVCFINLENNLTLLIAGEDINKNNDGSSDFIRIPILSGGSLLGSSH